MIEAHFNFSIDDFLKEYDKLHPNSSQASKESFYFSLRRIERLYNKDFKNIKLKFIYNLKELLLEMNKQDFSFNTIYATMSAVSKIIRIINPEMVIVNNIKEIMNKLKEKREGIYSEQVKTIKEESNWMDYRIIIKKLDNELTNYLFEEINEIKYRNFMLLNLMLREFPVRLGNFSNMHIEYNIPFQSINNLDKSKNYIILNGIDSYIFVFNKYKTSKTYGAIVQAVEDETNIEILNQWFKVYKPSIYFLRNNNNKILTSRAIGDGLGIISKEILGKKLSCDMIRHIYITHFMENNPRLKDKILLSDLMGHSLKQQELYKKY